MSAGPGAPAPPSASQRPGAACLRYACLAAAATLMLLFYSQATDGGGGAGAGGGPADHLLRLVDLSPAGAPAAAAAVARNDTAHQPLEKAGYLVWSPSCQIPHVDAYDESIRKFLKPVDPIVCSRVAPLTFVAPLGEEGQGHVLRVDKAVVPHYAPRGHRLTCCYSNVTRFTTPPGHNYTDQADNYYNISSCSEFEKEVKLKPEEEFILVRCNSYKNGHKNEKKEVYANMHGIVPIKPSVAEKRRERKSPDDDAALNVLMVGYDSMSRLSLLRTMPRTVAYLKRAGYIDLQGYNKIGDNTFPNIMAVLTGMDMNQLKEGCWPSKKTKVDDCPLLWKEFHNHSYVSAYAEDEPTMSTFNYQKTGFLKQPTDYYFRPYMLAASKKLKIQRRNNLDVCMGPISTTDHILRYALDFVTTFKNSFYFALFWMNNFSHNDINVPGAMDLRTLQFFNELDGSGTYNNTIVIFFSDHGMRFGKIRQTHVGWLEERLPFIYILLPDWFKYKYPEAYQNLQTNRNRLTSTFDLYVTLKDVLERGMNSTAASGNVSLACPKCKSFFSEEFGDRSCDDAGVTPHWCTCTTYTELSVNDAIVQNAAKYVLSEIQKKVRNSLQADSCAELIMHQVIKAKKKVHINDHDADHDDYVVIFETLPGGGLFETTVRHSGNSDFSILGMVSRINSYARDSFCVKDGELKLYCFCLPT
ncbi:hypothetical protein R5R35_005898 [Gryllus longicercus]|uniref:Uncharacterized protein n=1 Tax=Gryllus longicercus TaxID=2509291 RepID=A0AAN9VEP8_9ORTH